LSVERKRRPASRLVGSLSGPGKRVAVCQRGAYTNSSSLRTDHPKALSRSAMKPSTDTLIE